MVKLLQNIFTFFRKIQFKIRYKLADFKVIKHEKSKKSLIDPCFP